jgi:hypothetical protein
MMHDGRLHDSSRIFLLGCKTVRSLSCMQQLQARGVGVVITVVVNADANLALAQNALFHSSNDLAAASLHDAVLPGSSRQRQLKKQFVR